MKLPLWIFAINCGLLFASDDPKTYTNDFCGRPSDNDITSDPYLTYLFGNFPMSFQRLVEVFQLSASPNEYCPLVNSLIELNSDFRYKNGKDPWAQMPYLLNYMKHLFLGVSNLHYTKAVCPANGTSQIKRPKIYSIFHEYNMPYEVPCLECSNTTAYYGSSFYTILNGRTGFDKNFECLSKAVPCTEALNKNENIPIPTRLLRNTVAFASGDPLESFRYPFPSYINKQGELKDLERHGAIFFAERKTMTASNFDDLDIFPRIPSMDASLLLNPGLELYRWKDAFMAMGSYDSGKTEQVSKWYKLANRIWKNFNWNSGSYYCLKVNKSDPTEESSFQTAPDFIVNVDSLIHPYYTASGNHLKQKNQPRNWYKHMFDATNRFKIGDYEPFDDDNPTHLLLNASITLAGNLKLGIHWKKWSCCSRCCCTELTCGPGFDWQERCENIPSYRTRIGLLSWFKTDPNKKVRATSEDSKAQMPINVVEYLFSDLDLHSTRFEVTNNDADLLALEGNGKPCDENHRCDLSLLAPNAYSEFDHLLTHEPYRTEGIPVFSTMFNTPTEFDTDLNGGASKEKRIPEWMYLERALRMIVANNISLFGKDRSYRDDSPPLDKDPERKDGVVWANYPAGSLGMFVDMAECDLEEKRDCNNLLKCRQKEAGQLVSVYEGHDLETIEPTVVEPPTTAPLNICTSQLNFTELKMNYQGRNDSKRAFLFVVKDGGNYMIAANKEGVALEWAHWHYGADKTHIGTRNTEKCNEHQVFTANGSLFIIDLRKDDIKRPYVLLEGDQHSPLKLKAILHYEKDEALMREYKETLNSFWVVGISVVSGFLAIGFVGICLFSYQANKIDRANEEMQKEQEAAVEAPEETGEATTVADKEATGGTEEAGPQEAPREEELQVAGTQEETEENTEIMV